MVEIYQNANTVGTDIPTCFVMIFNPKAQSPSSAPGDEHLTVESAKEEARARVDRRLERERKRRQRVALTKGAESLKRGGKARASLPSRR
jgi:hypothetical protein